MPLGFAIGSIGFAAALTLAPATPSPDFIGPRVRGVTPAVNALLAKGAERSPTFARLIRELNDTDVVVYVEMTADLPPGLDGRLTFMANTVSVRYLHVQVSSTAGLAVLIAITGHELQHALEVAAHPEVKSSDDLAVLYRRIGLRGSVNGRYDTAEARSVGRRVRAELS
ncbi:hypothetical protein BH24ACI5_BH24ACI5_26930 [soil metagenome]